MYFSKRPQKVLVSMGDRLCQTLTSLTLNRIRPMALLPVLAPMLPLVVMLSEKRQSPVEWNTTTPVEWMRPLALLPVVLVMVRDTTNQGTSIRLLVNVLMERRVTTTTTGA